MKRIIRVSEWNMLAEQRYQDARQEWQPEKGGYPSRAMYMFLDKFGEPRKDGWIVTEVKNSKEISHQFVKTKKQAMKLAKLM